MRLPDFRRLIAPSIPHQLHDDGDAIDGDAAEAKPVELELANPLGFC